MSERLRIVHAVRSDGFAGVERHVASLAAAQADAGHAVAVVGGEPTLMANAIGGARVRRRPAVSTWATARGIDALAPCDLLHVHMTAAEVAALLAPRAWRTPVVSTRHFAGRRGRSLAGHLVARVIPPRIAAQIAISGFVAEHVEGAATVVYPGVPSRPDGRDAGARDRTVLVLQRLEAEKRTDLALRGFAASGLAREGWTLDVAGDGAQRSPLEALSRDLGIAASTRFLGRIADVESALARAGILLAPCPFEGLGLAVIEAMAAGLPVVAAGAGGHLETVGAVAGAALYPPQDPEVAGSLLAGLARDVARRDAYAVALRTHQRSTFTMDAQWRATEAVYRSVL